MNSQELIDLEEQYGAHNYRPLDVVLQRGEGVWVYDVEGKRYLDCLSSYSALNQGHCHPRIMETLVTQARNLTLTSRAFRNDQLGPFYQEICQLTGYEMVLPMNTGAEAVETAIKAARKWGYQVKGIPDGQAEIITCAGNFHGRTLTVISFSTEPQYKEGFAPYTPGFVTIPFGDADALRAAITPNTAAFLFEPLQGEGGVIVPPAGYLRAVRDICTQHNVLMMADEIQTGLGRTGRLFACDHEGVKPDVMILGKALSGGAYPVSVVLASRDVLGVFKPGDHGMIENAARMGDYFQERLVEINSPHIKEVRGKGLLIGVELHPQAGGARRFCEALQSCGVLAKETHTHVIRFAPPLIITRDQVDWMLDCIQDVLAMP
jgi:ornithine--oxo-acid transaminase